MVQQDVTYSNFGTYDVGLRVSNLDDNDYRFLENYVRLYYKDDWSFGADSWSVTGTTAVTDFVPFVDANGSSWIYVPHTIENEAKCVKSFTGFPSNKLEFIQFPYVWIVLIGLILFFRFLVKNRLNLWRIDYKIQSYSIFTIGISIVNNILGLALVLNS